MPASPGSTAWQDRTLVKTWAMRGTLHLLPAAEYPLWQAGLGTYRHYLRSSWFRYFGLTREELERLMAAVAEALDGTVLTREELAAEVGRRAAEAEAERLAGYLGGRLELEWASPA